MTVYFIGAGPGDPELLTVKGKRIIEKADVVIYAGSLVNREILGYAKKDARIYNSAEMTLEEMVDVMAGSQEKIVARVHSGDPSIYGAINEQIDALEGRGAHCEVIPGVSSFTASAARLKKEFTVPEVVQTVIITRLEGRTPVPEKERLRRLARHRASMCIFLSASMIDEVVEELIPGYGSQAPVVVVYKVTWPDEKVLTGSLADISDKIKKEGIDRSALILVGDFLKEGSTTSRLYDKDFGHGFRKKL